MKQPDIRPIAWRKYRLKQDWNCEQGGFHFLVKAGFEHDGASVPRLAWSLSGLRPDGLIRAAALLHDALYHYGGTVGEHLGGFNPWKQFSRKEADAIFYELMVRAGIAKWRAYIAYKSVRVGGRGSWQD